MSTKNLNFDRATKIVNSWPAWKRDYYVTKYSANAALKNKNNSTNKT